MAVNVRNALNRKCNWRFRAKARNVVHEEEGGWSKVSGIRNAKLPAVVVLQVGEQATKHLQVALPGMFRAE